MGAAASVAVVGVISMEWSASSRSALHSTPAKAVAPMSLDERLDLEFAYTSYDESCRDLYSPSYRCRRPFGHGGLHAAGFGSHRVTWVHHPAHGPDAPPMS